MPKQEPLMDQSQPTQNKSRKGADMEAMKIKFDSDTHSIEANTLINSLIHFTTVVHEVNKEIDPNREVEIKIVANAQGSFLVDFLLQTYEGAKTLLTPDRVNYAADLAGVVEAVYNVASFLGGRKPKKVVSGKEGVVSFENFNGDVNYFDLRGATIYTGNKTVREAISQQFATLENDDAITGFELLDKDEIPKVEIPKAQFAGIASEEVEEPEANEKDLSVVTVLNVASVDFELKKKWDFYYNGHKISAKVLREAYQDVIDKGERFGKGDSLEVEMTIRQLFSESVNAYINKSFTVTKIIRHFTPPVQGGLGFEKPAEYPIG